MSDKLLLIEFLLSFAVAYILLGMFWYSKFAFGSFWKKLNSSSDTKQSTKQMILTIGSTALMSIGTAYVLNYIFLAGANLFFQFSIWSIIMLAAITWLAFSGFPALANQLHQKRSWKLFAIDSGFVLAYFVLFGIVWYLWVTAQFN